MAYSPVCDQDVRAFALQRQRNMFPQLLNFAVIGFASYGLVYHLQSSWKSKFAVRVSELLAYVKSRSRTGYSCKVRRGSGASCGVLWMKNFFLLSVRTIKGSAQELMANIGRKAG